MMNKPCPFCGGEPFFMDSEIRYKRNSGKSME